MSEPVIEIRSKRVIYAQAFLTHFKKEFDEAAANNDEEFAINNVEFDQFIVANGFCSYTRIPEKGSAEWALFRKECNLVRAEVNAAAPNGVHGDPPFRLDYSPRNTYVRLLAGMVRITHAMMAQQVLSLANTKQKGFDKMTHYLRENVDSLPPYLQGQLGMQERMFDRAISTIRNVLEGYIEDTNDLYEKSVQHLEEDRRKAIGWEEKA